MAGTIFNDTYLTLASIAENPATATTHALTVANAGTVGTAAALSSDRGVR